MQTAGASCIECSEDHTCYYTTNTPKTQAVVLMKTLAQQAAGYLQECRPDSRPDKASSPERVGYVKTGNGASTGELHPERLNQHVVEKKHKCSCDKIGNGCLSMSSVLLWTRSLNKLYFRLLATTSTSIPRTSRISLLTTEPCRVSCQAERPEWPMMISVTCDLWA